MASLSPFLRGALKRALLLAFSLSVALLLVEVALRVADYSPAVSSPLNGFHVADAHLGWVGVPNYRARFKTLNFDVVIETDEEGFRKVAAASVPDEDAPEVWVMGDSTVWGWGVDNGELFVDVLQEAAGPSLRIRNFGINAYGTLQELLLLERLLTEREAPEKVILMVCGNDFTDNLSGQNLTRPFLRPVDGGKGFEIANLPVQRRIGGLKAAVARHSRALSFLFYCSSLVKQLRDRPNQEPFESMPAKHSKARPEGVSPRGLGPPESEAMAFLLRRIDRLCHENGIALDVLSFPQLSRRFLRSSASVTVEEICGELNASFVDIETGMAEGRSGYYIGNGDFHWNAEGNRKGAEVYLEEVGARFGLERD